MRTLKNISVYAAALVLTAGAYSCKKGKQEPQQVNPATVGNTSVSSARMGYLSSQLYAVANTPSGAWLYTLSSPPGVFSAAPVSGFSVGVTAVTDITGLAFTNDTLVVSTASTSNFPDRLLIYPYPVTGTLLNAPNQLSCAGIKDIEYNEYNSTLYGILNDRHIVAISRTAFITIDYTPTIPPGRQVSGLCNYNALLSYCVNDGTPAPDEFYSYGPDGSGPLNTLLFRTDWDGFAGDNAGGGAGTQYVNGTGWEIITENRLHKSVAALTLAAGPFMSMSAPPSAVFADITSN